MKRLTDVAVKAALKPRRQGRRDLLDGAVPGLTLRVGPHHATWSLVVRVTGEGGVSRRGHPKKGKRVRLSLGEYPQVTLDAARSLASAYLDQAKRGINPARTLESSATAGGFTIQSLCERFLSDYVQMKELRAFPKYEGALRVHVVPRVGDRLADTLTRGQVRELLRKVMVRVPREHRPRGRPRGGKEAARSVLAVLRKMISWGIAEELLHRHDNPASGMESNLPRKRRRERVLSLDEARIVWRAAETLGYPFGPAYQLILLTGCRPGEWARARRPWIDLKQNLCVIPAERYKSDHVHVVPLVDQAAKILSGVLTTFRGRGGDFIFSGTDGRKPIAGWPKAQARMMRAICAVTGERPLDRWTPHDLRRTVATRIAEQLGVGGEQLIKRVLGHADGSVTAIYNRYGYVKEMREVLERWAADLTAVEATQLPRLAIASAPESDGVAFEAA
ncbi:MAG: tyrosine-type recombinase/integrase [Steroidobacteraceae bacterium]